MRERGGSNVTDRGPSGAPEKQGGVLGYVETKVGEEVKNFYDPRFEGRRLFSEVLGTFGLMVMAMILFMGAVSGAHFNPVVSVGFAMRGDFPWKRVPGYLVAQLIGSILAVVFLRATLGNIGGLGTTEPGPGISATTALIFEAVLTLGLLSTILGTASGAQNIGVFGAIGVGAYIALAGLWSAPISGTSMNPTRSLGPMIVSGNYHDWYVYIVGPFVGGLLAVGVAWILRGRGGGIRGRMAAQGDVTLNVVDPSTSPHEAPPA
jgi:aquaporin Z